MRKSTRILGFRASTCYRPIKKGGLLVARAFMNQLEPFQYDPVGRVNCAEPYLRVSYGRDAWLAGDHSDERHSLCSEP